MDDQIVDAICAQITVAVEHITADKMYDTNTVYQTLKSTFQMHKLSLRRKIIRLRMSSIIQNE